MRGRRTTWIGVVALAGLAVGCTSARTAQPEAATSTSTIAVVTTNAPPTTTLPATTTTVPYIPPPPTTTTLPLTRTTVCQPSSLEQYDQQQLASAEQAVQSDTSRLQDDSSDPAQAQEDQRQLSTDTQNVELYQRYLAQNNNCQ